MAWNRPRLARDITLALAIKLAMLIALKYTFFNTPQHMPAAQVAQALLAAPASSLSGIQYARQ